MGDINHKVRASAIERLAEVGAREEVDLAGTRIARPFLASPSHSLVMRMTLTGPSNPEATSLESAL